MIETNNPDIDVEELMARIREEVANRRKSTITSLPKFTGAGNTGFELKCQEIMDNLSVAEQNAGVGTIALSMKRFNRAIRWLAKLTSRIVIYLTEVITFPQRHFNHSILHALRLTVNGVRDVNQGLAGRDNRIAGLEGSVNQALNRIAGLEDSVNQALNRIAGLEESVNQSLAERDSRIAGLDKTVSHLKTNLILQERRIGMLLEEARKRLPEPFDQEQLQAFAKEEDHFLDSLYVSFEDQFRGTRQDIKDRSKIYLPLVKEANAGTIERPILDVGCGRGEWLELLKEEGFKAQGLDTNRVLVEQCRERGIDVVESDVFEYLRTLPDARLGAVTGLHIIEHLTLGALIKLIDETVRVLKPGGVAIFETPNPQNIIVGACNFYIDPTHRNPLHPEMMRFLVESRGFCQVEIHPLHPFEKEHRLVENSSEILKKFNDFFYGPQDYAVIGVKP